MNDATLTMALTGKNEIVGTLYYMSPEQLQAQATGQEIDGRSDIFSFGLVLYEMLTGKRAFEGSSPASVIAAIMERPAPSIADVAPPALDRVLQALPGERPRRPLANRARFEGRVGVDRQIAGRSDRKPNAITVAVRKIAVDRGGSAGGRRGGTRDCRLPRDAARSVEAAGAFGCRSRPRRVAQVTRRS